MGGVGAGSYVLNASVSLAEETGSTVCNAVESARARCSSSSSSSSISSSSSSYPSAGYSAGSSSGSSSGLESAT
ncbi:hypothetical protein Tco_1298722 [Tanacetum coccineum]